jgi:hypothetical protein
MGHKRGGKIILSFFLGFYNKRLLKNCFVIQKSRTERSRSAKISLKTWFPRRQIHDDSSMDFSEVYIKLLMYSAAIRQECRKFLNEVQSFILSVN